MSPRRRRGQERLHVAQPCVEIGWAEGLLRSCVRAMSLRGYLNQQRREEHDIAAHLQVVPAHPCRCFAELLNPSCQLSVALELAIDTLIEGVGGALGPLLRSARATLAELELHLEVVEPLGVTRDVVDKMFSTLYVVLLYLAQKLRLLSHCLVEGSKFVSNALFLEALDIAATLRPADLRCQHLVNLSFNRE